MEDRLEETIPGTNGRELKRDGIGAEGETEAAGGEGTGAGGTGEETATAGETDGGVGPPTKSSTDIEVDGTVTILDVDGFKRTGIQLYGNFQKLRNSEAIEYLY